MNVSVKTPISIWVILEGKSIPRNNYGCTWKVCTYQFQNFITHCTWKLCTCYLGRGCSRLKRIYKWPWTPGPCRAVGSSYHQPDVKKGCCWGDSHQNQNWEKFKERITQTWTLIAWLPSHLLLWATWICLGWSWSGWSNDADNHDFDDDQRWWKG